MKKLLIVAIAVLMAGTLAVAQEAAEGVGAQHEYIGVKKCSMCHKGERKGNIFETWKASPHANAYATLGSEDALKVAAEQGIEDPQTNGECLECHVTAWEVDASLSENVDPTNGVTCEACHGPGGDYGKMSVMKDRDASIAAGMVANPKEGCVDCHNENSPTYKPFDIEEFWPKIEHSVPAE